MRVRVLKTKIVLQYRLTRKSFAIINFFSAFKGETLFLDKIGQKYKN